MDLYPFMSSKSDPWIQHNPTILIMCQSYYSICSYLKQLWDRQHSQVWFTKSIAPCREKITAKFPTEMASVTQLSWKTISTPYPFLMALFSLLKNQWKIPDRRKLRSQASDNMDRWKSRGGKSQRREEGRRSEKRKSQKKEDGGARKGRKVAKTLFFQCFGAPEGRKVGSVKRRVRSHLARWEMTNCRLLWREAIFAVKMYKTHHSRSTFGSWDVEKVHAIARRCGAQHISKSKCTKHLSVGPLLEVEMSKKCTPCWPEAHFEVKMYKTHHCRTTFGRSDVVSRGRREGLCALTKVSKTWEFCDVLWHSKNDGRHRTFEEDLQRCISRGRRSTRDVFIRDVRRSGHWFPERGCTLEHQIFRFANMILRDRCSASYDLASLFRGRRSTLDRWSGTIANFIGTRPSALHPTFQHWRKSRRIASFLMEVSWIDVVKFKHWGRLAELLRFWRCQLRKLRKSRRIVSFSSLQITLLRYTALRYTTLHCATLRYPICYASYTTLH